MDFRDILSLIFILVGIVVLVIARVLMAKGMWSFYDSHKEWSLNDLHSSGYRRGIESPYELCYIGVMLICAGIVSAIGFNFGLKAGGWALVAVSAALLAFNAAVRLRHVDRDYKDAYTSVVASIIITIFSLLVGLFIVAMT